MNKSDLKTGAKTTAHANTSGTLEKRALATELVIELLKSNPKNNYSHKHNVYTVVLPLPANQRRRGRGQSPPP